MSEREGRSPPSAAICFLAALAAPLWRLGPSHGTPSPMAGTVHCVKLGREAEALEKPPLKGEVGDKIFKNVSKEAWAMWLEHSKMLINEYRLDLTSENGQQIWYTEMDKFFFGDGSAAPPDFVSKQGEESE